jgi:hypothetical protein
MPSNPTASEAQFPGQCNVPALLSSSWRAVGNVGLTPTGPLCGRKRHRTWHNSRDFAKRCRSTEPFDKRRTGSRRSLGASLNGTMPAEAALERGSER